MHFNVALEGDCKVSDTYLEGELSGWADDDGLDLPLAKEVLLPEVLGDWETEGKGLARACQVTSNHILSVVDWVKTVLLDWEQIDDASLDEKSR